MIRIDRNPSPRDLALFAAGWLVLLAVVGLVLFVRGASGAAIAAWAAAPAVPVLGLLSRRALCGVYVGLAYATWPLGMALSIAILAIVYYLVVTPTGLLLRLCGHDPLGRRFDRQADTYWSPHEQQQEPRRYFRQF